MYAMYLLFFFVLGAVIGSFLNVCIWRSPRGESVLYPPSHCPRCDTQLRPLDLVPILSQVLLRARCRYCQSKISWRYAGIESLTGVLFVVAGLSLYGSGVGAVGELFPFDPVRLTQFFLVVCCLVVIFWVDFDTLMIPMTAALLLGLAGVGSEAYRVLVQGQTLIPPQIYDVDFLPAALPHSLVAMLVTAGGLALFRSGTSLLYGRETMGFGDVFLTAGIAANLGWSGTLFTFLFLSSTVGALAGLLFRLPGAIRYWRWARSRPVWNKADPKFARRMFWRAYRKPIPFGPMLAVGALIALLYGAQINQAYLSWVESMNA